MDLLQAALEYASLGLPVVPLHHPTSQGNCSCSTAGCSRCGKHPQLSNWQRQASTEPATLWRWWNQYPEANLGWATGDGLLVVDIDGAEGEAEWQKLLDDRSLPTTAEAVTGSGGRHLYLRVNSSYRIANKKLAPHIDIRGDGGLVVAAPSLHACGRRYVFPQHPRDGIAEAPEWLREKLLAKGILEGRESYSLWKEEHQTACHGDSCSELLEEVLARFPIEGEGQRNDRMVQAVGSLFAKGLPAETVESIMTDWLRQFQTVYRTPWPEAVSLLQACIQSTLRNIANGKFQPATATNHLQNQKAVALSDRQRSLLQAEILQTENRQTAAQTKQMELQTHLCPPLLVRGGKQGVQPTEALLQAAVPLCRSRQEKAFVEALLVMSIYEEQKSPHRQQVAFTNDQIRELMQARCGQQIDAKQLKRLKRKYIARPEAPPPQRFELLRLVELGSREGGEAKPSLYEPTGLKGFLEKSDHWSECYGNQPETEQMQHLQNQSELQETGPAQQLAVQAKETHQLPSGTASPAGFASPPSDSPQPARHAGRPDSPKPEEAQEEAHGSKVPAIGRRKERYNSYAFLSRRQYRQTDRWKRLRRQQLQREAGRCRCCERKARLVRSRPGIIQGAEGLEDDPLVPLCRRCNLVLLELQGDKKTTGQLLRFWGRETLLRTAARWLGESIKEVVTSRAGPGHASLKPERYSAAVG